MKHQRFYALSMTVPVIAQPNQDVASKDFVNAAASKSPKTRRLTDCEPWKNMSMIASIKGIGAASHIQIPPRRPPHQYELLSSASAVVSMPCVVASVDVDVLLDVVALCEHLESLHHHHERLLLLLLLLLHLHGAEALAQSALLAHHVVLPFLPCLALLAHHVVLPHLPCLADWGSDRQRLLQLVSCDVWDGVLLLLLLHAAARRDRGRLWSPLPPVLMCCAMSWRSWCCLRCLSMCYCLAAFVVVLVELLVDELVLVELLVDVLVLVVVLVDVLVLA